MPLGHPPAQVESVGRQQVVSAMPARDRSLGGLADPAARAIDRPPDLVHQIGGHAEV
jgi:hypothetical protein